ncbi:coilin [Musca domestica]|uniref:Coilin n=1 Tax=Musca domestica TaxID=7370 RepID=A0A1I8M772_MUSDO|nr:coilin [Musca domestica]
MSKFSIKIDLSTFFEDERQMVLLMVDTSVWTHVKCLQKRVESLFEVDSVRFLNEGCFLHPNEPIEILKFCKELKAFVPKESLEKRKSRKSAKHKESCSGKEEIAHSDSANDQSGALEPQDCVDVKKKRKYRSLGDFNTSTPNNCSKRVKNCIAINATIREDERRVNKSSEITSTSNEQMPPPSTVSSKSSRKSKKSKQASISIVENSGLDKDADDDTMSSNDDTTITNQGPNISKNISVMVDNQVEQVIDKHETSEIRKRKQKELKSLTENSMDKSSPPARNSNLPSSTFINNSIQSNKPPKRSSKNPFRNSKSSNSRHLFFNESGEISTTTNTTVNVQEKENKNPPINIVFRCQMESMDTKIPRILHIKNKNMKECSKSKKKTIEIQENILIQAVDVVRKSVTSKNILEEANDTEMGSRPNNQTMADNSIVQDEDESVVDSNNSIGTTDHKSKEVYVSKISNGNGVLQEITTTNNDREVSEMEITNIEDACEMKEDDNSDSKYNNESSILSVDCVDLSTEEDDASTIQNSKKVVEDLCISDTSDVEEVIDLNETDDVNKSQTFSNKTVERKSSTFNRSSSTSSIVKISQIISWCKDTKEMPNVGDIMIFKIPFTNRHGNPDCTKFLAGKAERIQHRTKTIKFLILDGHSELHFVSNQYLNNYLDNSMCDEKFVQIKFNEMIQPRLLPKNKQSLL